MLRLLLDSSHYKRMGDCCSRITGKEVKLLKGPLASKFDPRSAKRFWLQGTSTINQTLRLDLNTHPQSALGSITLITGRASTECAGMVKDPPTNGYTKSLSPGLTSYTLGSRQAYGMDKHRCGYCPIIVAPCLVFSLTACIFPSRSPAVML